MIGLKGEFQRFYTSKSVQVLGNTIVISQKQAKNTNTQISYLK